MKILLIGNYIPDRQESMQRFAELLFRELSRSGLEPELLRPEPRFNATRSAGGLGKYLGYADKLVLFPAQLRRRLRENSGCVVHICDHSNALYTRAVQPVPHVVTCHDLLAVRSAWGEFPANPTRWSGRRLQRMVLAGLNRAQHVACVSQATRADVLRLTKLPDERVEVIYNGLNHPFAPMDRAAAFTGLRRRRLPARFILHVGGDHWYKNRAGLLEIYAHACRLDPTVPALILAGAPLTKRQEELAHSHGVSAKIISLARPTNAELGALYSLAELLLFPSLVEGFGWPIIEAQACGCPVVTSNRAPMTEIGGDAAAYVDPDNPRAAAGAVLAILSEDAAARAHRVAQSIANASRFSTKAMIEQYVRIYKWLGSRKLAHVPPELFPVRRSGDAPLQNRVAAR